MKYLKRFYESNDDKLYSDISLTTFFKLDLNLVNFNKNYQQIITDNLTNNWKLIVATRWFTVLSCYKEPKQLGQFVIQIKQIEDDYFICRFVEQAGIGDYTIEKVSEHTKCDSFRGLVEYLEDKGIVRNFPKKPS